MTLKLIHSKEPTGKEGIKHRARKMRRDDGVLQCNACGCRTSLTTVNNASILNGRKQGGTVIDKDVCAECWRRGRIVSMFPELKPIR